VLLALGAGWAAYVVHAHRARLSDWLSFEIAARSFIHFQHNMVYAGNPFALYARIPALQFGPPSWLPLAGLQWLSPWGVKVGFVMVMVLLGVLAVMTIEAISRQVLPELTARGRSLVMLVVGGGVVVAWAYNAGRFQHLDDVMGLTFTVFACGLIQRRKAWWLVGLLLGTAVAAKPWAIILTPVLLGLPRKQRSKVALETIVVAAAWWLPFVVGGSGTIRALASYPIAAQPGSVLWLLGVHGEVQRWLHPVQFVGGIVLAVAIARSGGRNAWLAAPLAAVAFRVLTDPYSPSYYGLGPVLFALLWDTTRPGRWTRLPIYSAVTLLVEGLVPWLPLAPGFRDFSSWGPTLEWAKLVWGLAIIAAVVVELRSSRSTTPGTTAVTAPPLAPADNQ
jgi:hypothetical protein